MEDITDKNYRVSGGEDLVDPDWNRRKADHAALVPKGIHPMRAPFWRNLHLPPVIGKLPPTDITLVRYQAQVCPQRTYSKSSMYL